ncbi:hypothetical protein ABZZ79_02395 [Streptomyces sp. NPDC006458]|uniref:hypothetical protein n=1 Tax=Streptomyces sp. NPDC006458 TaxID=3154302 RepID=UPI0033A75B17
MGVAALTDPGEDRARLALGLVGRGETALPGVLISDGPVGTGPARRLASDPLSRFEDLRLDSWKWLDGLLVSHGDDQCDRRHARGLRDDHDVRNGKVRAPTALEVGQARIAQRGISANLSQ